MMVTEVTCGLEGVLCHMDDILVWGKTQEEHDAVTREGTGDARD